ncbi:hypothetical protein WICPIJ_006309 [Wickerhamomyces pijperi]|uniref:Protein kinase domain-containing protein n=1 Tax=Wickerhamomyces pijperi TaxID=599730 RepID=A0A9P8Q4I3_WICPI|nr:hypothetical protein WICPIJ_006309 [Wickerhamomyces pijperi]
MATRRGFIEQSDSDDGDSFHPPVLSKYALELLQREETTIDGNSQTRTSSNIHAKHNDHQSMSSISQNTINTNQTEHETIFTKNVNTNANTDVFTRTDSITWNTATTLERSKHRRIKPLSALGPPKRAIKSSPGLAQEGTMLESGNSDIQSRNSLNNDTTAAASSQSIDENFSRSESVNHRKHFQSPESRNKSWGEVKRVQPTDHVKKPHSPFNGMESQSHEENSIGKAGQENLSLTKSSLEQKELMKNQANQIKSRVHSNVIPFKSERSREASTKKEQFPVQGLDDMHISNKENEHDQKNDNYIRHHYKHKQPLKPKAHSTKFITVNGRSYEKLELIGKGGSSKVFKVKSNENKVYAIKKISLDEFETSSIVGFRGEIDLLKRLREEERVVKLIDESLDQGSLLLVMECGDIDLSQVLQRRMSLKLDFEFIRFHTNEILKCVKAVHDAGIIHSDLKPANFLFVKGMLKIIDFGIANAVPEHTMNIYRDSQIGTPNYMAPEALVDTNQATPQASANAVTTWKVGKPADVWSCGCIIYQMVYGRPPYGHYQGAQRLFAIMNPEVKINYPTTGLGDVIVPVTLMQSMQQCLMRDPTKRSTIDELLNGEFCKPRVVTEEFILKLVENALSFGNKNKLDEAAVKRMASDVWRRLGNMEL